MVHIFIWATGIIIAFISSSSESFSQFFFICQGQFEVGILTGYIVVFSIFFSGLLLFRGSDTSQKSSGIIFLWPLCSWIERWFIYFLRWELRMLARLLTVHLWASQVLVASFLDVWVWFGFVLFFLRSICEKVYPWYFACLVCFCPGWDTPLPILEGVRILYLVMRFIIVLVFQSSTSDVRRNLLDVLRFLREISFLVTDWSKKMNCACNLFAL